MFYFLYSFWSGDPSPQALRAALGLADSARCACLALMLLRRRRDILRFGITEPSKLGTSTFLVTLQSFSLPGYILHLGRYVPTEVSILIHMRLVTVLLRRRREILHFEIMEPIKTVKFY